MSNDKHTPPGNGKPVLSTTPDVLAGRGRRTVHLGDLLFGGSARASSLIIVVVVLIIGTFLLGNAWQPLLDNTANFFASTTFDASSRPPHFGVAALLWTTVLSSLIALLIAVPVAVGAGTLNDLVKLAAFELGRDYACVGTAASMDGYTGSGAPMSSQGVKVTRACKAPAVIVMDLDVAAAAPAYLTASGYGDLAAKIPGGADWILADATGVEPIDPDVWRLVQSGVATALSDPDALAAGQPDAFRGLVEGLCLSGLAMQAYGGTRPASGAEHYFSHLWELAHLGADLEVPLSHGAKVAVGSLAMCAFYEALIGRDLSGIDVDAVAARRAPWPGIEANIRNRFEGALADHAVSETRSKYLAGTELADRLRPLVAEWPEVTERLRAQLVPTGVLADRLRRAGAPSRPEDIGVTREDVRALFPRAMYYRSRYTALDVAWELGLFEDLVAEVFEKIWV